MRAKCYSLSTQTHTLIVGASFSGLAVAACLQKRGIEFVVLEKTSQVGNPWHNHYQRLHLHTNKSASHLPFKKFNADVPRYPSRVQVIDYLQDYQRTFDIQPIFNTEVLSISRQGTQWVTETSKRSFTSNNVVICTGAFCKPQPLDLSGMQNFRGQLLHSSAYKTGKDFKGQRVLVVGFGNSACEIALDLCEQGAIPAMSVRSPVNVIPRDILGIPIIRLSLPLSLLPPRLADKINAPLIRLLTGDIRKLGLKKMSMGPLEQIEKTGTVPLLDIGTLQQIRNGHIKIYAEIGQIGESTVSFKDGQSAGFDAIVAATGYFRDYTSIVKVEQRRFDDLKQRLGRQQYFGEDGLYFCGFWIATTGQIREISLDAQKIALDIARKSGIS